MLIKAYNDKVPNLTVVYSFTGWQSPDWPARVKRIRAWCKKRGISFVTVKGPHTFESLCESKKGFPMPGKTWCSFWLKALPFLEWADRVDPGCKAVVMIGKRRDESFARRGTPLRIKSSENHGGRPVWHPLAYVTEVQRDTLLTSNGFDVLPTRSKECSPCVNANRTDMVHLAPSDQAKTIRLEGRIGQHMFRPHHHMGAEGFGEVMKWARSARGQYEPPEEPSPGCTEGYCE